MRGVLTGISGYVPLNALMKTVFSSPDAPPALGPYSQAIGAGPLIFCSGQVPLEAATGEIGGPRCGRANKAGATQSGCGPEKRRCILRQHNKDHRFLNRSFPVRRYERSVRHVFS